jgi:UDP:flavonoid glycosyltransferase YjiC (YdhE family)
MAASLKGHGIRTVAVINDLTSLEVLQGACDEVIQAPAWPLAAQSPAQRAARSSATLNDVLASAGLADTSAVRRLLTQWDAILNEVRPQLVVADFAPMAALAARDRTALLLVGNGYTLPPSEMPRFPPLHRKAPPRWNEDATLAAVNEAARAMGRPLLERLPQLFSGDTRLVQTFELLDPYHSQRLEPVDGPLVAYEPRGRLPDADLILVYLSGGYDPPIGLLEALRPLAGRLRIVAPGLSTAQRQDLTRCGARFDPATTSLGDVLPCCGLVVHRGGSGVATEALLAGVPQLIVSAQIEQTLNGQALQRAGIGRLIEGYDPEAVVSADLIAMLAEDSGMAARAAEAGDRHRQYLSVRTPALSSENACLALLR